MLSRVDRYRQHASACSVTDYAEPASVLRRSAAVDEMRRLVAGPEAVAELTPLLEEPEVGRWLAFQLLELTDPPPSVAERCLAIIRQMAVGGGVEAMGAKMWLREYTNGTA